MQNTRIDEKSILLKTVTHHGHMTWAEGVKDELMQDATCLLSFTLNMSMRLHTHKNIQEFGYLTPRLY